MSESFASQLAGWPEAERIEFLSKYSNAARAMLQHDWNFWGRPEQQMPQGDWNVWLVLAGRGWGKTRCGAEMVRAWAQDFPGCRIALVGRTAADVRDVMVEGESGITHVGPENHRPVYEPSKRRLTWPNGSQATCYSAEEPSLLRGPQHHFAWCDELASWQYVESFDMLQMTLRLGDKPRVIVTTTPRPTKLLRDLISDASTFVTRGTTFDNSENIAIEAMVARYEGTTLGRQELYAEMLDDAPGALWKRIDIDKARVVGLPNTLRRIVIGVDPAVTSGADSDETGIVACAVDRRGQYYVINDASCRASPDSWARKITGLYAELGADLIVAEANNGGDLVTHTIRTVSPSVNVRKVHASRGKHTRAEPIAALYEQGRVSHVGTLATLEDQLCTWEAGKDRSSPDRLDALVWALTELHQAQSVSGFELPGSAHPNDLLGL